MEKLTKQEQVEALAEAWHPHWWLAGYEDCFTERNAAIREAKCLVNNLGVDGFEIVRKEQEDG